MSDVNMIEVEATVEDIQDIEAQIDETEPLNLDGYYRNNEPIVSVDDIPPNAIMPLSLVYGSDRTNKNVQFSDLESAFRTKIQYSTVSTTLAEPEVMAQTLTGFVSGLTLYGCSHLSNNLWSLNPSYEGAGTLVNKEKIYLDAGTYTISFKSNINNSNVTFTFYKADGTTSVGSVQINRPINKATVTLSNDARKVLVSNGASSRVYDIQIESGSEATDYEAYGIISCSGDVNTRNLNGSIVTSAHTDFPMIGIGDSRLLSNYLTINPKFGGGFYKNVDLRNLSELTWTKSGDLLKCTTIKYIVSRPSANDKVVRALCDSLKVDSYSNVSAKVNDRSIAVDTNGDIYVYFDEYKNDINGFKTEMARTNTKFIYQMNDYEFTRPSNDEIRQFMRLRLFAKTYFSSPNGCCDFEYVSNQVIMDARSYTAYVDYYNGQAIDSVNERVDDVEEEISNINATKTTTTSPITDSTEGNINAIKLVGSSHKSGNLWSLNNSYSGIGNIVSKQNISLAQGTYTISFKSDIATSYATFAFLKADGTTSVGAVQVNRPSCVGTVTLTDKSEKVTIYNPTSCTVYDIQIYEGTSALPYEPYGIIQPSGDVVSHNADNTKSSTVHTDRPLLSIGNIKNELIINADGSGKFVERVIIQNNELVAKSTPTTTDLSVSEVAEMLALKTYSGQTYIDTDGAEFEVSYFVDSNIAKAISDNKGYITEVAESVDDVNDRVDDLSEVRSVTLTPSGDFSIHTQALDVCGKVAHIHLSFSTSTTKSNRANIGRLSVNAKHTYTMLTVYDSSNGFSASNEIGGFITNGLITIVNADKMTLNTTYYIDVCFITN